MSTDEGKPVATSAWKAPSNIAIVKYWGKKGIQLPVNPSVSLSLKNSCTRTEVALFPKTTTEDLQLKFFFEGKENGQFAARVLKYLNQIAPEYDFLWQYAVEIKSSNTFPHSAGIASSASSYAALALCLLSLKEKLETGNVILSFDFFKKASDLARLGSGSAARSLFPTWTIWGKSDAYSGSCDDYAFPVEDVHPVFQNLCDKVIVVNPSEKKVSSSAGHSRMTGHPFAEARILQANNNTAGLIEVLKSGDFNTFAKIAEEEALTLHSLMMTSDKSFILLEPETLNVIKKIRQIRDEMSLPLCFTLDAGPNVHVLFPKVEQNKINDVINREIITTAGLTFIDDEAGQGPELIY
jgi:diphosphomevalonate decarboxylase